MQLQARRSLLSWWFPIVAISVALLITTYIAFSVALPGSVQSAMQQLNLGNERNIAAWWSSMLLLLVALGTFGLYAAERSPNRYSWLIISIFFMLLSWDENASFHERIGDGGWSAYLPYILAGALPIGYAFIRLLLNRETRVSAFMIGFACFLFGTVAGQEFLESRGFWPANLLAFRVVLEEGTELIAMFLCLLAIARLLGPGPRTMKVLNFVHSSIRYLPLALVTTGILHSYVTITSSHMEDIGRRGAPGAWYPSAVFLILSLYELTRAVSGAARDRLARLVLSASYMVASVSMIYLLSRSDLNSMLFYILVGAIIALSAFFFARSEEMVSPLRLLPFALLAILLAVGMAFDSLLVRTILAGGIGLGLATIALWRPAVTVRDLTPPVGM